MTGATRGVQWMVRGRRMSHLAGVTAMGLVAIVSHGAEGQTGSDGSVTVTAAEARPGGGAAALLVEARQALFRHEFADGRRLLGEALGSGPTAAESAEAHRRLAVLAWRFDLDFEWGRGHLTRAEAAGEGLSETHAELARLELGRARHEEAWRAAERALAEAGTARDSARAVDLLAEAALRETRRTGWPDASGRERLERVRRELGASLAANPASLMVSGHLIQVAILLDDGPGALAAWRSYFEQALDRPGPLPGAARALDEVLPRWSGPLTPRSDRIAAIDALAASAMFEAAALLATDPRLAPGRVVTDAPTVADVIAYTAFLRDLDQLAAEYHRRVAAGDGDPDRFRADLLRLTREVYHRLSWPEGPPVPEPPDSSAHLWRELSDRFGAEPNLGSTGGVYNLYYGHRIIDERREVEQYGHRAEVRFISLDGLASNGYQTWAWDGAAANGGWQWRDVIVQIRPGYAGQGASAWNRLHAAESPQTGEPTEPSASRCAYVPGLWEQIEKQGLERMRASLQERGLEGEALRAAFFAEFDRERVESSIFLHEGRHAIDRVLGIEGSEELEFRAKLAEVAFARFPRLALNGILSPNVGDPSPHGQANARVLCGVVDWMEVNGERIAGFDRSRPILPQLRLLTDDQIREAFRSLDPLAGGAV